MFTKKRRPAKREKMARYYDALEAEELCLINGLEML